MSGEPSVAFLVQRIGPYHHARLSAWASSRAGTVDVIEFRPADAVYAWAPVETGGGYRRVPSYSRGEMDRALDAIKPQVVVCVGYADREIHCAMGWALKNNVPLVTCSDSTLVDERRSWVKEMLKRSVVASFDAALVAGSRARSYLAGLGVASDRCFAPWDVVDNAYFERGADQARGNEAVSRARLKLPPHYFVCVARFVPKKNLERLIDAYARYAERGGELAWGLVLVGAGPLETPLRARVTARGINARVHFPGFLQYPDLPACYGLAGALVLPSVSDQWGLVVNEAMAAGLPVLVSSRCGCAPDLVREGENGFTFDPGDTAALAQRLTLIAAMSALERAAVGSRARALVAGFSPSAFSSGLEAAVACALKRRRRPVSWLTRVLLFLSTSSARHRQFSPLPATT